MAEIRPLAVIKEKWGRVTPQRSDDYKFGIQNPRRDWEAGASAAEGTYKDAIVKAAAAGLYGKGVKAAGTAKWKDKSIRKGPTRFAEGVMIGTPDYEKGFAPFHDAIAATVLPPRFPRGDPRNIERTKAIDVALNLKRVGK